MSMLAIDTTNMCSHLQRKLFEKDGTTDSLKAIKEDIAELSKYYSSELWKTDFAADEAGHLPPNLKRGVLSEDGIWNLLADYREILFIGPGGER